MSISQKMQDFKTNIKHSGKGPTLAEVEWLIETIEQYELKIKEMKQNSRLINFYAMAEENLRLAEENASLKEQIQ